MSNDQSVEINEKGFHLARHSDHPIGSKGHRAFMLVIALLFASIAILWGWNTLAVDLFQAPAAKYKHALALTLLCCALFSLFHIIRSFFTASQPEA